MTTTAPRPNIPQPEPPSTVVSRLTAVAAWVTPGIIAAGWVFGAPASPAMVRQRYFRTTSTPADRWSR
jgi:hypothetical protein